MAEGDGEDSGGGGGSTWDWGEAFDSAGDIAGAAFRWMGQRDAAKYRAQASAALAPALAAQVAQQGNASLLINANNQRTLIIFAMGFALILLIRVRATGNADVR